MVRLPRASTVLLSLGCLATACRLKEDVRPTASPQATCPSEARAGLRWVMRGARLMVDERWLLDPEQGVFTPLPYATSRPVEGGGTQQLGLSLSGGGGRVVVWDEREFRHGPVGSALSGPFPIPDLAARLGDAKDPSTPRRSQLLFWDGQDRLMLSQQWLAAETSPACGVFEPRTHSWQPVAACPEADFLEITEAQPGPGPWMAFFSEAEGARSWRLTRYPPGGPRPEPVDVSFPLFPLGSLQAEFSLEGPRVELATPCALEQPSQPCRDADEEGPWRLYSWLLQQRRLVLRQEGLAPHFAPAPTGERIAWPLPGRVCIAPLSALGSARCHALPATPCAR